MKHGSLFSGIGGFDLAAEWMGWENVFHCEWNEFGQKVLKYYWPKAISYDDITKTDFTIHRGAIDILTGGFPCQPYSSAGKRKGKEDERHLWPQMLRAIREIAPSWVVGENVYGLVNWSGGLVFHEVQADLEAEGYEVFPFLLPAVSVNAPHRRDRIWFVAFNTKSKRDTEVGTICERQNNESFGICKINRFVAHSNNNRHTPSRESKKIEREWSKDDIKQKEWCEQAERINGLDGFQRNVADTNSRRLEGSTKVGRDGINAEWESESGDAADTFSIRLQHSTNAGEILRKKRFTNEERSESTLSFKTNGYGYKSNWENFPTVSPVCFGDDGLSDRLDNITFPKWRNESIKAGGNAIVPQVVYQIFKSIEQYERPNGRNDNEGSND